MKVPPARWSSCINWAINSKKTMHTKKSHGNEWMKEHNKGITWLFEGILFICARRKWHYKGANKQYSLKKSCYSLNRMIWYYNRPERRQWLCKLLWGKQGALWFMSDVKMANKMITELQGLLKNFLKSNKYKDSNGIKK